MRFGFRAPRILFGAGEKSRLAALAEEAAPARNAAGGGPSIVLTGSTRREELRRTLGEALAPLRPEWIACPAGEPTVEGVDGLLGEVRRRGPGLIVAVGGGSVLDTAKAVAALAPLQGSVLDYLEGIGTGALVPGPGVPWIAVPTTAGTGAEASWNAVVKSSRHGLKRSLRSPHLLASWALVDPELCRGVPRPVAGAAGMDALAQLIEAYVSRKGTPMVRALVRGALPAHLAALESIARGAPDDAALSGASYGALASGIALANSGLGAVHGFAAALGGLTDLPHGLVCAVFLAPVLRANADAVRDELAPLCRDAGMPQASDPVAWLAGRVEALLEGFSMPRRLARGVDGRSGGGFSPSDLEAVAHGASGSSMSGNPVDFDVAARVGILREVLVLT